LLRTSNSKASSGSSLAQQSTAAGFARNPHRKSGALEGKQLQHLGSFGRVERIRMSCVMSTRLGVVKAGAVALQAPLLTD